MNQLVHSLSIYPMVTAMQCLYRFLCIYNVCVWMCALAGICFVLCTLCICVYASTSVSAGVCELATNKVTG